MKNRTVNDVTAKLLTQGVVYGSAFRMKMFRTPKASADSRAEASAMKVHSGIGGL